MAKLQKEKRSAAPHHHARHSTSSQPSMKAVRLTPAEIRAQNNGDLSRSQSQIVPNQSSKQLSEGHVTPPPSPTKEPSAYQTQLARTASQSQGPPTPPTPPRSPRLSHARTAPTRQNGLPFAQPQISQYRQSIPIEAYRGIVGIPAPTTSRTSSISGSIKAPMKYRGHEITRTGSLSMFQAPQPDIVMNPLSNFSRPRYKYSPPGSFNRQDGNAETYQSHHRRNDTAESAVSSIQSRSESPMLRSDSLVSSRTFGSRASRQFVIVTEDSLPKTEDKAEHTTEPPVSMFPVARHVDNPKNNQEMKKTASVYLERTIDSAAETETKKKRRHTFSWKRMPGMDFKADFKNDPNPPKEQPVAVKVEMPRPQSVGQPLVEEEEEDEQAGAASTPEDKGKGKEIAHDHGLQVIGVKCCDKCGRIKKLQDGRARVNDGKTKETLVVAGSSAYKLVKTNNDLPGPSAVNRAGAANAAQLIMHRQRRLKPEPPALLPNGHVVKDFAATAAPEAPKVIERKTVETTVEPPVCITRFASLHGISHEKETALEMPTLKTNLDSNTTDDIPQMKAASTPIDEPLPEFVYNPANDEDHFVLAPSEPRRYSFESQRSIIDVTRPEKPFKTQNSAPEVVPSPPEPIDLSKPIVLPEPNFGLHFARSNQTLRGLVVPKGRSSSNLLAEVLKTAGETDDVEKGLEKSDQIDQVRRKHQSTVGEIMAV